MDNQIGDAEYLREKNTSAVELNEHFHSDKPPDIEEDNNNDLHQNEAGEVDVNRGVEAFNTLQHELNLSESFSECYTVYVDKRVALT